MSLHPSGRALLAFEADTLSPARRRRVADHLRACDSCRRRLGRRRDLRAAAASVTSPPAPDVLRAVHARMAAGDRVLLPVPHSRPTRERRTATGRIASGVAVALAAATGAAAAGLISLPIGPGGGDDPSGAPAESRAAAGIDVPVPTTGLTVELLEAGGDLRLRVAFADAERLEVLGLGEAALARFRSSEDRVVVEGAAAGELRVVVPRGSPRVRIRIGGVEVAETRGDMIFPRRGMAAPRLDGLVSRLAADPGEPPP